MTVDEYFTNQLKSLKNEVTLTADERKMLELGQLEEFLFRKITSKKFRRNKLSEQSLETIRNKVHLSVSQSKPIYLIFGFGGFKNANVTEHHPHIGWGEVFNLLFLSKQLAPILQNYAPGVIFEFEAESVGVVHANNFTQENVDVYRQDFLKLIDFFKQYIPDNLEFRFITLEEQYDTKAMLKDVEARLSEEIAKLKALPEAELEPQVKRATHNLKIKGREDLSKLNADELREEAIKSLVRCYTFLDEDYKHREGYFNGEERIMTIGAYCSVEENPDNWITINSTSGSPNAFWTSHGVLEQKEQGYTEVIIGPGRYNEIEDDLQSQSTSTFAGVTEGLNAIQVYSSKKESQSNSSKTPSSK